MKNEPTFCIAAAASVFVTRSCRLLRGQNSTQQGKSRRRLQRETGLPAESIATNENNSDYILFKKGIA